MQSRLNNGRDDHHVCFTAVSHIQNWADKLSFRFYVGPNCTGARTLFSAFCAWDLPFENTYQSLVISRDLTSGESIGIFDTAPHTGFFIQHHIDGVQWGTWQDPCFKNVQTVPSLPAGQCLPVTQPSTCLVMSCIGPCAGVSATAMTDLRPCRTPTEGINDHCAITAPVPAGQTPPPLPPAPTGQQLFDRDN